VKIRFTKVQVSSSFSSVFDKEHIFYVWIGYLIRMRLEIWAGSNRRGVRGWGAEE
jgi:hypothetical protein